MGTQLDVRAGLLERADDPIVQAAFLRLDTHAKAAGNAPHRAGRPTAGRNPLFSPGERSEYWVAGRSPKAAVISRSVVGGPYGGSHASLPAHRRAGCRSRHPAI